MNTLYKEYFITIKTLVHHKDNHKHMHPVTKHQDIKQNWKNSKNRQIHNYNSVINVPLEN